MYGGNVGRPPTKLQEFLDSTGGGSARPKTLWDCENPEEVAKSVSYKPFANCKTATVLQYDLVSEQ